MTDIKWPEGATHKINDTFTKWVDGVEYSLKDGEWVENSDSWSLDKFKKFGSFELIERPIDPPYVPKVGEWCEPGGVGARYFYVGVNKDGGHLFEDASGDYIPIGSLEGLRPVKTKREKFIEKARELVANMDKDDMILAGKLFDNGFKAPE
jgi:hypothetical protein